MLRAILIVLLVGTKLVNAVDVRAIIANPHLYDTKRVTITGVIHGDGPTFELFESAADGDKPNSQRKSIFIRATKPLEGGRSYNLRRVRVTGVIDANRHGLWGNACELQLESIRVLSSEPVAVPSIPIGVFRNERSSSIVISLYDRRGEVQATFGLGPKGFIQVPVQDGSIGIFTTSDDLIATKALDIRTASPFYDTKYSAFYFLINEKGIKKVLPKTVDRRKWGN